MKTTPLSVAQREALRAIAEDRRPEKLNAATLASLVRRGLVSIDGETMAVSLTPRGTRLHEQVMASGDGPEMLKQMFTGAGLYRAPRVAKPRARSPR